MFGFQGQAVSSNTENCLDSDHGKIELEAVLAELLHNERE